MEMYTGGFPIGSRLNRAGYWTRKSNTALRTDRYVVTDSLPTERTTLTLTVPCTPTLPRGIQSGQGIPHRTYLPTIVPVNRSEHP